MGRIWENGNYLKPSLHLITCGTVFFRARSVTTDNLHEIRIHSSIPFSKSCESHEVFAERENMFRRIFTIIRLSISEIPDIAICARAFLSCKIERTRPRICLTYNALWCDFFIFPKCSLKYDFRLKKYGQSRRI